MTRHTSRRAFTLIELLFYVAMIGIFTLLAAELFQATVSLPRKAGQTENALVQFDAVLKRLSADVWSAASLTVTDERTVQLRTAGGGMVTWRMGEPGRIQRLTELAPSATLTPDAPAESPATGSSGAQNAGPEGETWEVPDLALTFGPGADGAGLTVRVPGRQGSPEDRFLLISQVALLRKGVRP